MFVVNVGSNTICHPHVSDKNMKQGPDKSDKALGQGLFSFKAHGCAEDDLILQHQGVVRGLSNLRIVRSRVLCVREQSS